MADEEVARKDKAAFDLIVRRAKYLERLGKKFPGGVPDAKNHAELSELRRMAETVVQDRNLIEIVTGSIPHLKPTAEPGRIDAEWRGHFVRHSELVSDKEVQSLWSRILAGEANTPGSISKRALDLVSKMEKSDAELFTCLARFFVCILHGKERDSYVPLILDWHHPIVKDSHINWDSLAELESLGLIKISETSMMKYVLGSAGVPKIAYFGEVIDFEILQPISVLRTGVCHLTKIGRELAPYGVADRVPGFLEYLQEQKRVIFGEEAFIWRVEDS
jgi:hypothetical protein